MYLFFNSRDYVVARNVLGDLVRDLKDIIVINGTHDAIQFHAKLSKTSIDVGLWTTAESIYIPMVYGDYDMPNIFVL